MYISNSKRLLFIAIPKTACTSILYALSSNELMNYYSSTHVWNFKYPEIYHATLENTLDNIDRVEHLGFNILDVDRSCETYEEFENEYVQYENKLQSMIIKEQYYKAAFVRNPWDKFVSGYLDMEKHVPGRFSKRYNIWATQEETPDWYKSWDFKDFEDFCLKFEESEWYKDVHFKSQFDFVSLKGKVALDFVGRYENLIDDYKKMLKDVDCETIPLPHYHKSDREKYRNYYNNKTKEIIKEFYKKDIEEFGYEF